MENTELYYTPQAGEEAWERLIGPSWSPDEFTEEALQEAMARHDEVVALVAEEMARAGYRPGMAMDIAIANDDRVRASWAQLMELARPAARARCIWGRAHG